MTKQTFYIVWNPQGTNPRYRHDTYEGARAEATRLAKEHAGQQFFVMAAMCKAEINSVIFTEYDNIPF